MKRNWLVGAVVLGGLTLLAGCGGHNGQLLVGPGVLTATFVGSDACRNCHAAVYAGWHDSGHHYKLNKIIGGQPPTYPFSTVPQTPPGTSWSDFAWVIGGYGWKARWIDKNGYIYTGTNVQYNLATGGFTAYHSTDPVGTKPYDCGRCHTTGWTPTGPNGPHQDGQPGMYGTFAEAGIGCEGCHGAGSQHVQTANSADIQRDPSAEVCGRCHTRDAQRRIEVSGGFVRHHEQYDELISAGHVGLQCVDCHDAHKGAKYQRAINRDCETCHTEEATTTMKHTAPADCEDCHMPHADKSATASNDYSGDLRNHIIKINTDAVDKNSMFYSADGKTFAHGFVTLDFACYGCHQDNNGVGGPASKKSIAELSAMAKGIHQVTKTTSARTSRFPGLGRRAFDSSGPMDDED